MSIDLFTCVTCNIAFNNPDLQRAHYKTDWHRYNLKRKVADMPAINLQDFQERVQLQKIQTDNSQVKSNDEMFCKLCSKHFSNENSFANHKNSKKHKELEAVKVLSHVASQQLVTSIQQEEEKAIIDKIKINDLIAVKSDRAEKKALQIKEYLKKNEKLLQEEEQVEIAEENIDEDDKSNWEEIDEDEEMDLYDESKGIQVNDCFFCDHKSKSLEEKCEHMARVHSFYIPDMDHVTDLEGFLRFLGVKLGVYHVCLWCSGKCYRDLLSVRKHMSDKGHQKIKFEGETLLEYVDFYTFDDEDESMDEDFELVNESNFTVVDSTDLNSSQSLVLSKSTTHNKIEPTLLDDETFELELPSGAKIGHRSLFRYYKQSFGHRNLELKKSHNLTVKDKYLAIANNGICNAVETKKVRKDLAYFQRWNAKMHAKLGWESNKLQKHFRRQDLCF